jgi:hypothetical protein
MQTNLKLLILLLAASAFPVSGVSAQACLGLSSFTVASVHINGSGEFADSANAYAVGVGAGKHNGLFANLGAGQVLYTGLNHATFGFLEFGVQLPVGRMQLCPIAGGQFAVGPDDDAAGIKVTSRAATAGLALGLPIGDHTFKLIPNAAVKYEYLSQKLDEVDIGSSSETLNSGVVDLGVGFGFRDRFSIQPLAHIPFGGQNNKITYGIFASVSVGRPAR